MPGAALCGGREALELNDALGTIAEVGVALAGFSTLVSAFRERESGLPSAFYSMHLRQIVTYGLAATLLALLPLALPEPERVRSWRWFSAALAILWALHLPASAIQLRRSARADPARVRFVAALVAGAVGICGLVSQLLNALQVGLSGSFHGYLFGLILLLFGACFSFIRMVWVSATKG